MPAVVRSEIHLKRMRSCPKYRRTAG
jgi:hypothetical protein